MIDKIRMKFNKAEKAALHENAEAYHERLSRLTTSEYKLFMLLREGFTKNECSQRLNMKRRDVNSHVKRIYSKLHVRSLAELIVKYREAR
ncbi:MAG: LuxR C-terminal-related transcriptional regulator [Oscillospiraceae bacterium]|nr:LuxR C-terminal-related transcriptional regulator [Oscillospiraceae bacterium]